MDTVIAASRALCRLGYTVILISHNTKTDGDTPRGHSSLYGDLDVALKLTKGKSGVTTGMLYKNRNGAEGPWTAFKVGVEDRGQDEDGDTVTVAYAVPADVPADPDEEFDNLAGLETGQREAILEAIGSGYCRANRKSPLWTGKAPGLAGKLELDLEGKRADRDTFDNIMRQMVDAHDIKRETQTVKGDKQENYVVVRHAEIAAE